MPVVEMTESAPIRGDGGGAYSWAEALRPARLAMHRAEMAIAWIVRI